MTETDRELLKKGLEAARTGRNDEAVRQLRKLVLLYPHSDLADNAHYNLGKIYRIQGQTAKALVEFKTVLDVYPDSDAAVFAPDEIESLKEMTDPACDLFYLGQGLMVKQKPDEALVIFERITREYPDSDLLDNAWLALAQIAFQLGHTASGIEILDRIERDFPGTDAAALVPELRKR